MHIIFISTRLTFTKRYCCGRYCLRYYNNELLWSLLSLLLFLLLSLWTDKVIVFCISMITHIIIIATIFMEVFLYLNSIIYVTIFQLLEFRTLIPINSKSTLFSWFTLPYANMYYPFPFLFKVNVEHSSSSFTIITYYLPEVNSHSLEPIEHQ